MPLHGQPLPPGPQLTPSPAFAQTEQPLHDQFWPLYETTVPFT
jgi:hypothetical protein